MCNFSRVINDVAYCATSMNRVTVTTRGFTLMIIKLRERFRFAFTRSEFCASNDIYIYISFHKRKQRIYRVIVCSPNHINSMPSWKKLDPFSIRICSLSLSLCLEYARARARVIYRSGGRDEGMRYSLHFPYGGEISALSHSRDRASPPFVRANFPVRRRDSFPARRTFLPGDLHRASLAFL